MITEYTPVVRQIAGGFQRRLPRNVLRDDLVAAGMSGLWDAIVKHGTDRGESFDWYVRVRIRGAILDELRAKDWLPRRARAAAAQAAVTSGGAAPGAPVVLRFDDVSETEQARCLISSDTKSGEQHLEEQHTRAVIAKAVAELPERERNIVALHYFKGMKFKDLGHMLGVSEPRISQLHSRAMGRLKVMLAQEAA
jgi:RNA polymerase sigma factor for flagellar operon FliA